MVVVPEENLIWSEGWTMIMSDGTSVTHHGKCNNLRRLTREEVLPILAEAYNLKYPDSETGVDAIFKSHTPMKGVGTNQGEK